MNAPYGMELLVETSDPEERHLRDRVSRLREDNNEERMDDSRRTGVKMKIGISKSASSLQSPARRRSLRLGSSLPLDADLSSYVHPLYGAKDVTRCQPEDVNTPTSTLVYGYSARNSSARTDNNIQDNSSSIGNPIAPTACNITSKSSHYGQCTDLVRIPTNPAHAPSMSSWNNSLEKETDYVVDSVKGNAYLKGKFLGKGGFARVYLMTDIANGYQYACKIIPKNRMQKIHMQKVAREIMIHKELNHVNVVQMHHYFEDSWNVYMLLEACPRKSLMHVLKYRGKVTEPEARYYMRQMVTGVEYIHSQRVVHRDLKPGNMFLSDRMIVKIGDFGLATRLDGQRRRVTICGTPNYIAPEVLYKQSYGYEADVWALGCILYALLAGQPPFDTATLKETYARICSNHYRVDDTIASRGAQDLIKWLLQPNPELRPTIDRINDHVYLAREYVPKTLPHVCCYQKPPTNVLRQPQLVATSSTPSSISTLSRNREPAFVQIQPEVPLLYHSTIPMQQLANDRQPLDQSDRIQHKESKVSNWFAKKLPKLPRFKNRLSSVLCSDGKKTGATAQSVQMCRALEACLADVKRNSLVRNTPTAQGMMPLFISKWIDYSNKYGLVFQLSDKSVGVLFNDNTKIGYTHDRRRIEYVTMDEEVTRYQKEKDVPEALQWKLELLRLFTQYMDNFLTEGGEIEYRNTMKQSKNGTVPRMRRWLRTDKAIVMELTVPLLQVNFFIDHTKMVVSQDPRRGYLVTYIDTGRHASSYWLSDLSTFGCTSELYKRLNYVCKVAREFSELDNQSMIVKPTRTRRRSTRSIRG